LNFGAKMRTQIFQNETTSGRENPEFISRIDFLKRLALTTGVFVTSCTPLKIILNTHEEKYGSDKNLREKILTAFVTAVIPGADTADPNLCKIFCDDYYPFHKYSGFLISDLCNKSKKLFGNEHFDELSLDDRTKVIASGLADDSTTNRIYTAAIFITQVSVYCSIYDDDRGCSLINSPGSYGFVDAEMFHPNNQTYLAKEITSSGNYS
jgi:hypothetical protein